MKTSIAMGLAFGLLLGANAVKGAESLDGTWRLVAGETNGKAYSEKQLEEGTLVIKGDHYSVVLEGKDAVKGMQTLDPSPKIKTIDITDDNAARKNETCLGIYEIKGDKFRVAFAPPGKPRPTKFDTAADDGGYWMHVWERVKK